MNDLKVSQASSAQIILPCQSDASETSRELKLRLAAASQQLRRTASMKAEELLHTFSANTEYLSEAVMNILTIQPSAQVLR